MKEHSYLCAGLTAGAFLLIGAMAVAQTAPASRTTRSRDAASGQAAGMAVDHAGGNGVRRADTGKSGQNPLYEGKGEANVKPGMGPSDNSRNSAHATEALQRKHIAGVKYEDRMAGSSQDAQSNPSGTAQPNKMAIKENGLSSKPVAKPKP